MSAPIVIAVLGLGEAGAEIARDLVRAGAEVRGYDPVAAPPAGVSAFADEAEAVTGADLVLSVNSARDAVDALTNALPVLRPGVVWADLNTASPALKAHLSERAGERAVSVVDVALMAPVPGRGLRTPMLVAGSAADRYATMMGRLGAEVSVQPGPVGAAMSRKLLRSVFYKGLAAAVVEALAGAEAAGCEPWLRENIAAELAGLDHGSVDRLVEGTHQHARRRVEEMEAAVAQLEILRVRPRIAAATKDLLVALRDRPDDAGHR